MQPWYTDKDAFMYTWYPREEPQRETTQNNVPFMRILVLLVIIAVLIGILIVMSTPTARRLRGTQNTQRWADVNIILNSFYAYFLDNQVFPPNVDESLRLIGTDYEGCSVVCGGREGTATRVREGRASLKAGEHKGTVFGETEEALVLDEEGRSSGEGIFTSRLVDASIPSTWDLFGWEAFRPYGKNLPDNNGADTGYRGGNVAMEGNTLLLHFDDPLGATVFYDSSGTMNDALCLGAACPSAGAPGKVMQGVLFDGNDMIAVPHEERLDAAQAFAFSVWVRPYSFKGRVPIFLKTEDKEWRNGYGLYYDGEAEKICFFMDGDDDRTLCAPFPAKKGFSHLAGSYDGRRLSLYVNGAPKGSLEMASAPARNEMPLFIGGEGLTAGWHGVIDELALFNRPLSASEIYDIYVRGAVSVRYQVRSCKDKLCEGVLFVGPDGTPNTYFSEEDGAVAEQDGRKLFNVPDGRYFQYRIYLGSIDPAVSPAIAGIHVGYGLGGTNGELTAEYCVNLAPFLEGKYVDMIPSDPQSGTAGKSQYAIKRTPSGRIEVRSCYSEGGEVIGVIK